MYCVCMYVWTKSLNASAHNLESLPGWFPLKGRANCKNPELGLSFTSEGYIGVKK